MYIYYPSCNFAVMHRKTAKKVKEYFDAEVKFNVLLADVNKIIGDAVKDVLK